MPFIFSANLTLNENPHRVQIVIYGHCFELELYFIVF
jgi:hypothetical protein